MEAFRTFMKHYTALPADDWSKIASCFDRRIVAKNEILLHEGEVCRHLYFIESGLLRYYVIADGKDITKYFTEAPYCFTSQGSFTRVTPAREYIQAIEKSVLWQTTLKQATDLLELASWSTFIRKLVSEVQQYTDEILQELQTETAEARYLRMLQANAPLLQRVPLKYLASYFGIAPQSLSRIRRKIITSNRT